MRRLLEKLAALVRPASLAAAGAGVFALGVGMIYPPAGVIAAGLLMIVAAVVLILGGDG